MSINEIAQSARRIYTIRIPFPGNLCYNNTCTVKFHRVKRESIEPTAYSLSGGNRYERETHHGAVLCSSHGTWQCDSKPLAGCTACRNRVHGAEGGLSATTVNDRQAATVSSVRIPAHLHKSRVCASSGATGHRNSGTAPMSTAWWTICSARFCAKKDNILQIHNKASTPMEQIHRRFAVSMRAHFLPYGRKKGKIRKN